MTRMVSILFAGLLFYLQIKISWPMIGSATYLADQLDQTGAFFQLLQGKWQFFYGPYMSGTNPPAHCLGPLGAIMFGLPTFLGADPDQLHGLFILFVSSSLLFVFAELLYHDKTLAFFWPAAIFALPAFWWHHSLLWVNVLLLPITCLELAFFLKLLRSPSWPDWLNLLAIFFIGLHVHSSASLGIGLVLLGLLLIQGKTLDRPKRGKILGTALLLFLAFGPYFFAEIATKGANFLAVLQNLQNFGSKPSHAEGLQAAFASTSKFWTSIHLKFDLYQAENWQKGLFFSSMGLLTCLSLHQCIRNRNSPRFWSTMWCALGVISLTQFAFFYFMNRPLLSAHYTTFLIPYYVFPWAAISTWILKSLRLSLLGPAIAGAFVLWAFAFFPKDREPGDWNYRSISRSLTSLCKELGPISTSEGLPFTTYDGSFDSLLKFIGKRYVPGCQFTSESHWLLVPAMPSQTLAHTVERNAQIYHLVRTEYPGIGVYKR